MSDLVEMIRASVERYSQKPAFIDLAASPASEVSYGLFYSGACRSALRLKESGIEPGSRVVLTGDNSPNWAAACLGVFLAGCTVSPIDPEVPDSDLAAMLEILEPVAVICDRSLAHRFDRQGLKVFELESVEFSDEACSFEPVAADPEQPLSIVFTSGTTGRPKGVMLSQANFLHNVRFLIDDKRLIHPEDRLLNLLPLHHVYPFTATLLTPLCAGATVVYPRSLKSGDVMGAAAEREITIMVVVPQVLTALHHRIFSTVEDRPWLARLGFRLMLRLGRLGTGHGCRAGKYLFRSLHRRLPKLRYFACGGAKLEAELHRDLAALGLRIVEAYGLSETAPVVAVNDFHRPVFGSVGKAATEVRLKVARPNPSIEEGEVLVRGPNVMMGYYHDPEATGEAFSEGWFRTGDLGYIDKGGCLFLTGRLKEIIVMPSGKNIFPQALERHYGACELAEEVCICSLKDESGEHLTAAVVPSREVLKRKQSAHIYEDIKWHIENLALKLPGYQRVTRVEIVEQPFPKTRLGKLKRYEIIEALHRKKAGGIEREELPEELGEPDDPLLAFTKKHLRLKRNPRGTDNLETDLGLDSLAKLDFLSAVEQHFGMDITEEEAGAALCLDDLRRLTESRADGRSGSAKPAAESGMKPVEQVVEIGESLFGRMFRLWIHLKLWFWFKLLFRIRLRGKEHLPAEGPFVIAPNHVSYIDGPAIYAILPYRVTRSLFFVGTGDIFDTFPFSRLCYHGRIISTGRTGSTAQSLKHCLEILQKGLSLCLFPEGKRSVDQKVDTPKPGVAMLARAAGAPVLPLHIRGTGPTYSRMHPGFHLTKIEIELLPPIEPQAAQEEILARWQQLMQERDHLV